VLASLYLGGFFTVCALFGKGVNVYAYKIPNNTYSTPTTPLNEDLGGSRYDIQSSTENIMPQVEALNPNLGGNLLILHQNHYILMCYILSLNKLEPRIVFHTY